jgi:hypothetical protein
VHIFGGLGQKPHIERLPSGKFATNALVLSASMLAYNILLRWIGQNGLLGPNSPRRNRARRLNNQLEGHRPQGPQRMTGGYEVLQPHDREQVFGVIVAAPHALRLRRCRCVHYLRHRAFGQGFSTACNSYEFEI